jgi:hypothetical protein
MAPRAENVRKRKQTNLEAAVSSSSDDDNNVEVQPELQRKRKARRVSTNVAPAPNHAESIQSIGKMIQDLFCSDNDKVGAALDALFLNLYKDKKKCESLVTAGGCHALIHLMKNCLDKAIASIPACDQVTELNDLAELPTLYDTLRVIVSLTFLHDESKFGIAAIGGVEVVVKVMKTFPKCKELQDYACAALRNLTWRNVVGMANAIESGGIEAVLAAINNHFSSDEDLCQHACWALVNIARGSKENSGLLISFCGAAAVAKVRTKWPDNNDVQTPVRELANLFVAEIKTWADEEE